MIKRIKITNDILSLINNFHFEPLPDVDKEQYPLTYGLDLYNLYGGSYLFEDISLRLGRYEEYLNGTEEDPLGPRFEKPFEDYMLKLHDYITENLDYIMDLIIFYCNKGGIKVGVYKCHDYAKDWWYDEKESEKLIEKDKEEVENSKKKAK